jgi:ABC-type transport system involved in multi-copper enzyme maturation permease subunit
MTVWPVITRELRSQARQPFTYWLRLLGVVALLVGAALFAADNAFEPRFGSLLFGVLNLMLVGAIWLLVPLSAADCISRERREGTLGLLFLTPLKPAAIVVAKSVAHGLRAGTLLLAVLPVLTLPFLVGGVSWQQVAMAALVSFSSICWTLAAAVVASALSRNSLRAMAGAVALAVISVFAYAMVVGIFTTAKLPPNMQQGYERFYWNLLIGFVVMGVNPHVLWIRGALPIPLSQFVVATGESAIVAVLVLALAVWFAANRIRYSWREAPPSARVQKIEQVFFTPVLCVNFLRRWMRRKLERNPIGWLEQRRWSGRLVVWTWFAIIVSVQSVALSDQGFFRSYDAWENLMAWLLTLSMAASAAGSFRRERETGVLELLLVSPLTTREIISGRLRGLWGQFLPAIVALLGIWLYFGTIFPRYHGLWPIWYFAVTFLVLPVIGLYFSLRCRHFLTAYLLTGLCTVVLPWLVIGIVRYVAWMSGTGNSYFRWSSEIETRAWLVQALVATLLGLRLRQRLERRRFPLERGVA